MGNNDWKRILVLIFVFILLPFSLSISYSTKTVEKNVIDPTKTIQDRYEKKNTTIQNEDTSEIHKKVEKVNDKAQTSRPIKKKQKLGTYTAYSQSQNFDHSMFMDYNKRYFVQWKTNKTHITFDVQVKTLGWVGLGLAPKGGMKNADIAVMWVVKGKLTLQDRFAKGTYEPLLDVQQDWIPLYGKENGTHTIVGFSRLLDTCDVERDRKITQETERLLWAYHSEDPPNGQLMHHEQRGYRSVVFIGGNIDFKEPQHEKKISFMTNRFAVPSENSTTYRCFLRQIKHIDKKYYMIAANALISPETEGIVHHIILHLCDNVFKNPKNMTDLLCYEDGHSGDIMRHCFSELLVIMAIGGYSHAFPKGIGYPIDKTFTDRWVYMEVHYNNYNNLPGLIDNTQLDLYLTDNITNQSIEHEAGQLFFGLFDFTWELMIPPKQEEYTVAAYCSEHCLNNMKIPEDGLNVFLYFLHTHLTGVKIQVKVIRDGQELEPVMKDDTYDFNFQIFRELSTPFKIKKGDTLILECTYATMDKTNYTIGGFQTSEEMCLAYIYYYPKSDFTLCGSLPNTGSLVKSLGANTTMSNTGLSEVINFKRNAESLKKRDIVLKQMNTKEWTSKEGVEKLKTIFKNVEYSELCRYMSIPEVRSGKIPTNYKPYKEKPSTCRNPLFPSKLD